MDSRATKEEQAESLLGYSHREFAAKHYPELPLGDAVSRVYTLEPWEVLEYARARYQWADLWFTFTNPGSNDGVYVIRAGDSVFDVYYQERGIKMPICAHVTEDAAWRAVIKMNLDLTGTGYSLRMKDRLAAEGREFFDRPRK